VQVSDTGSTNEAPRKKIDALIWYFKTLDSHLHTVIRNKSQAGRTLEELVSVFDNGERRRFDQQQLAEVVAVAPEMFDCNWELRRQVHQLVVHASSFKA